MCVFSTYGTQVAKKKTRIRKGGKTMKKVNLLFLAMLLCILIAGNASAIQTTYNDDYANWPGWPQTPYPINTADQIGQYPTIASLTVNSSGGYLQSIAVSITFLRGSETLFINADYKMGESYEAWNYFAAFGTAPKFYSVDSGYEYTLVHSPIGLPIGHWRDGHPFGIEEKYLTLASGIMKDVTYAGGVLTYNFYENAILLGERYTIGMSVDCGNDVFLTPVPEPIGALLLGLGLLGLAAIRRKK